MNAKRRPCVPAPSNVTEALEGASFMLKSSVGYDNGNVGKVVQAQKTNNLCIAEDRKQWPICMLPLLHLHSVRSWFDQASDPIALPPSPVAKDRHCRQADA